MKIFILVVLIALTVQRSNAGSEEFTKIVNECKTSEKATDTDFMNIKNKVQPLTKEMKCLTTCIAEKMGLITKNQISAEGTMKVAKSMPNTSDKLVQSVTEILEECKGVQDPDRCEFGAKVMKCFSDGAAKRSINNILM